MERNSALIIVAIILAASIISGSILVFYEGGSKNRKLDNVKSELDALRDKYRELRENFRKYKESVERRLENLNSVKRKLTKLENQIATLEDQINGGKSDSIIYSFSFENGMEGWAKKGTDLDHPPVEWTIEPSQLIAKDGHSSLKYKLANTNDAGKIWIERAFDVEPNSTYNVRVSYDLASKDYGVNLWRIITGAFPNRPLKDNKTDLIFQGDTGTGPDSQENFEWLDKSYKFKVTSDDDGEIYVNIGIWGTWETTRFYFLDNVKIEIEPVERTQQDIPKNSDNYQTNVFDHPGIDRSVIENGLSYNTENLHRKNHLTLLTSEEEIDLFDFTSIPQNSEEFIKSTNFKEYSLLVFQEFPASSVPDYRVEAISKTGDTVILFLNDSSQAGTADITVETVLVRISTEEGDPTKTFRVVTEDGRTFQTKSVS